MPKIGKVITFMGNSINGATNCSKLSGLQVFKEVGFFCTWGFGMGKGIRYKNKDLTKVMHQDLDVRNDKYIFWMRVKGSFNNLLCPRITKIKDENLNNLSNHIK